MKKKLLLLVLALGTVGGALAGGARNAEANSCGYNVCYPGDPGWVCCDYCCKDDYGNILWCSDRPSVCSTIN
jgi:hypothetical protein